MFKAANMRCKVNFTTLKIKLIFFSQLTLIRVFILNVVIAKTLRKEKTIYIIHDLNSFDVVQRFQ